MEASKAVSYASLCMERRRRVIISLCFTLLHDFSFLRYGNIRMSQVQFIEHEMSCPEMLTKSLFTYFPEILVWFPWLRSSPLRTSTKPQSKRSESAQKLTTQTNWEPTKSYRCCSPKELLHITFLVYLLFWPVIDLLLSSGLWTAQIGSSKTQKIKCFNMPIRLVAMNSAISLQYSRLLVTDPACLPWSLSRARGEDMPSPGCMRCILFKKKVAVMRC